MSATPPPTLNYRYPDVGSRRYRKPPSARALIAVACFVISLITPAITLTSIHRPFDSEYTFGWQAALLTLPMLERAFGERDWPGIVLSLMPFCAQSLLLAVVTLEIVPSIFAIESPGQRSPLAARLSLAALPPAVVSLVMLRFHPILLNVPPDKDVSPSPSVFLWAAAFFTLLVRDWRLKSPPKIRKENVTPPQQTGRKTSP